MGEIMTSGPPEKSVAFHEMLQRQWKANKSLSVGKMILYQKIWTLEPQAGHRGFMSLHNALCYFAALCCFKVLGENHNNF